MTTLVKRIIFFVAIGIITAALIVGNVVCSIYFDVITTALCGTGISFEGEEVEAAQALGDDLCREIQAEGTVLLKNGKLSDGTNSLPLKKEQKKLNVFGWSATDQGFLLRGVGSGSSTIQDAKKKTFLASLTENGYEYKTELIDMYNSYRSGGRDKYTLDEPPVTNYTDAMIADAKAFSDTALVVISRNGGENIGEIPTSQSDDADRTYLDISAREEAMLELVGKNFENVIVILNTCNIMHCGFLAKDYVDSALYVGITGQSGAMSIPKVLSGAITPSGKTSDTYAYIPDYDPTYVNFLRNGDHIQYVEDIYYGYKWYETADAAGYLQNIQTAYGQGYDGVVQYPFGFGLSYTSFEWEVTDVSLPENSELGYDDDGEVIGGTITLSVTNTGNVKGKDVIQLYSTPPYGDECGNKSKIEKAHVNLVDFAKSVELEPGKTQTGITLKFDSYALSSYDCYDKNRNDFATYELDPGEYTLSLRSDAHTLMSCERNTLKYKVTEEQLFDIDPVTWEYVENRFTGEEAYTGVPIDGSTVGAEKTYMTRSDFVGTFPKARAKKPDVNNLIQVANSYKNTEWDVSKAPTQGISGPLRLVTLEDGTPATLDQLNGAGGVKLVYNDKLIDKLIDFDNDAEWNALLNQMTIDELCEFVEQCGFGTPASVTIGKPYNRDYDGPAGFNTSVQGQDKSSWTAYPSETVIGCTWNKELAFRMGLSMGVEAAATGVQGWYAPGVNLHRSHYNARNFEYYSEDGVISGRLASEVIRGAKANGLYCYLKHYALSEPGQNARNLNTWLTEQNLRENYLKPFEIAVKEGGANAIMSAFNRVGGTWAGASYPLLQNILRDEWGFRGSVLTDYSSGDSYMNPEQGIRAGNDCWLNPNNTNGAPISRTDPTSIGCARRAAKNILYTYIDTRHFSVNYDGAKDDRYTASLGIKTTEPVFPWWIFIVIGIDVGVAGVIVWRLVVMILKMRKDKRTAEQ